MLICKLFPMKAKPQLSNYNLDEEKVAFVKMLRVWNHFINNFWWYAIALNLIYLGFGLADSIISFIDSISRRLLFILSVIIMTLPLYVTFPLFFYLFPFIRNRKLKKREITLYEYEEWEDNYCQFKWDLKNYEREKN